MDGSRRSDAMDGSRRSDAMDGSRRSDAMDGLRESRRSWGMSDNDGGMRGSSRGLAPSDSDGMRGGSEWLDSGTSSSNRKSGMMSGDYERVSLGSSRSYMESTPSRSERFGPYESHDSRSALDGHDLYRSGYDLHEPGRSRFGDSYPDRSESSDRNFGDQYLDPYEGRSQSRLYDKSRSSWDDSYSHSSSKPRVRADSDTGRESYSSYSSYSTPLSKPSSGGSRGRGTLAYSGTEYGGGSYSKMRGQRGGRGRGRGREQSDLDVCSRSKILEELYNLCSKPLVQNNTSYQPYKRGGFPSNSGRGMKRKGIQPNRDAVKKQKLAPAENVRAPPAQTANQATARIKMAVLSTGKDPFPKDKDLTKDTHDPDEYECFDIIEGKQKSDTEDDEEDKKLGARREKQRRRRERNSARYGEGYRKAFTCSLCKFRTTEQEEIEAHLETPYHKETIEFIGKNIKFGKGAADFLHASMVYKCKRIAARKQLKQEQMDPAQSLPKDVLMGVSSDDHMKKVEAVHCDVCHTYIPFQFNSVHLHLNSNVHINRKKNYNEQVRWDSLLTANSMLNNATVKDQLDLYLKGEYSFENPQEQQQSEELEPEHEDEEEDNEEENQDEEERQADEADDQALEQEENQAKMEDVTAAQTPNQATARIKMTLLSTGQDPEKDEDFTKDAYDPDAYECFDKNEGKKKTDTEDEEEKKKLEARREKQRRRREKNTEKYGEDYRNAFTCSLCKFRTTEELEIEAHLETPYHKETLEFIGKNILFEKGAADFLHASMVNKNKKIAARKQFQQQEQRDPAQKLSKDVLMGVSSDDQMKKVEAVQCAVCNTYIPFLFHSVQQHLKSNEHINSKKNYHDQVRRESLLTASSMLNNPTVKAKFDLYLKGENPFENPQELQQQEQQQSEELEQEPEHEEDNEEGNEEENQEEEERQADEADDQAPEKEENQAEMEDVPCEPADP
ncbi:DBIRD complex subunit ZNF326 isoform X1 [Amblyraja radiata]|uniref:DBIRD complex subunit ZNF326 isoform X1 n=1 Tax=Amblyraja radiata TaxID=386614 RepID=UPI0014029AB1|nr:DBIRD complex subunit ZNF326 isoform X1 [Amblyraja radiata]